MSLQKTQRCRPRSSYANLPDLVLLKIFSYLTPVERSLNAMVCRNWYDVARSCTFWKNLYIKDTSPPQILKLLPYLPSCVTHLNICCRAVDISHPLNFPEFMARIRERCPSLKTLILDKMFFPENSELLDINHSAEQLALEKYPQELLVLSLRYSLFQTHLLSSRLIAFIPRIKVLDFTHSLCVTDEIVLFFSSLTELEELYLMGCPITGSGIANLLKAVSNLKVLDLENTGIGSDTFSDLKMYGQSLEKLYLANTLVDDTYFYFNDDEKYFQKLQILCLRNTFVSHVGLVFLLGSCRLLKNVNVTQCNVAAIWSEKCYQPMRRKFTRNVSGRHIYCNHFENNNIIT